MNAEGADDGLLGLKVIRRTAAKALKLLLRKHEKQVLELAETERAEWYRQVADSLLSDPHLAPRGSAKISLVNVHTQKEAVVSLNPRFDFRGNAELLYKKARKGARGREISRLKIAETEEKIRRHELLLRDIDAAIAVQDEGVALDLLTRCEKELGIAVPAPLNVGGLSLPVTHERQEKHPYRHFTFDEWNVYVGKNEKQNDELTTRFAKPQDVWLHAAGHAGSHVVIRRPLRTAPVPREIIEKAAALALWFSKAKHTSYGEVHVTEARFVHKRRHAPPGEVIAERCRAIRVRPRSPHEFFPSLYGGASEAETD